MNLENQFSQISHHMYLELKSFFLRCLFPLGVQFTCNNILATNNWMVKNKMSAFLLAWNLQHRVGLTVKVLC